MHDPANSSLNFRNSKQDPQVQDRISQIQNAISGSAFTIGRIQDKIWRILIKICGIQCIPRGFQVTLAAIPHTCYKNHSCLTELKPGNCCVNTQRAIACVNTPSLSKLPCARAQNATPKDQQTKTSGVW